MKPATVLAAVLVALGCAPFANADPVLLVNGSGVLTGAQMSMSVERCTT